MICLRYSEKSYISKYIFRYCQMSFIFFPFSVIAFSIRVLYLCIYVHICLCMTSPIHSNEFHTCLIFSETSLTCPHSFRMCFYMFLYCPMCLFGFHLGVQCFLICISHVPVRFLNMSFIFRCFLCLPRI